ncbi:MAG: folate-binding protein YgfZ [Actinomycetota bacterium]
MEIDEVFVADRSERGKLRFSGEQAAWFLHQVLTQAFEDIEPGDARAAALITPHGRMTGYLDVVATESALRAHFEPELSKVLQETLERHVFATRVVIEDVTESFGLVLVVGGAWPSLVEGRGAVVHPTTTLGAPAAYLWTEPGSTEGLIERLVDAGVRRADEAQLERIRIAHGAPRWGREMGPKTLPQEVGIDEVAVHYDKGCYLGQEAMAKIHFRGRVNRRLRRLRAAAGLVEGSDVTLGDERVGRVTSVADGHALALLRATVEPGAVVEAGAVEATVVE